MRETDDERTIERPSLIYGKIFSHRAGTGPVWRDKASMYLWIDLSLLTALYTNLISPSVESEATAG